MTTDAIERRDMAIDMLLENGGYDGAHHKMWVIDQALRILAGDEYDDIVREWCRNGRYEWDEGVTP